MTTAKISENYVALLGTKGGPAIRPGSSMPTSNLFCFDRRQIVVDCGLGVTRGLVDQGMQLKDLSLIFITHLHSDHYLELGPLIHTAWTAGLSSRIDVYGPAGLGTYWENFLASMKDDIDLRIEDEGRPDIRNLVQLHIIEEGVVLNENGLEIKAIRTVHPPLVDCFALSFQTPSTHVVFSGDTAPFEGMEDFYRSADLLIHEAMLEDALPALLKRVGNGSEKLEQHLLRSHSCVQDVAVIATKAGVKKLALSHLIPSDDPAYDDADWHRAIADGWSGPLVIGKDGIRIDL